MIIDWKIPVTSKSRAYLPTMTKTYAKVQEDPAKINALVEVTQKKFKLQKVTKINLMITAKCHAHLQTLKSHLQDFKKIQLKF